MRSHQYTNVMLTAIAAILFMIALHAWMESAQGLAALIAPRAEAQSKCPYVPEAKAPPARYRFAGSFVYSTGAGALQYWVFEGPDKLVITTIGSYMAGWHNPGLLQCQFAEIER